MNKLKPCPFCGGEAKLKSWFAHTDSEDFTAYKVACAVCCARAGCLGLQNVPRTEEDAIKEWNNRVKTKSENCFSESVEKQLENVAFERFGNSGMGGQNVVALDDAIEIVKQTAEQCNNGWVPCSERLPEDFQSVLCYAESIARRPDAMFIGSQKHGCWFLQSSIGTESFPTQYEVLAWMPLPKPYNQID